MLPQKVSKGKRKKKKEKENGTVIAKPPRCQQKEKALSCHRVI